jgi:asparagine synthase (glutamine-hydrolysing)
MCGIAGFADTTIRPLEGGAEGATRLVRGMCDVIRHRGPDDEGIRVEPGAGLGMRRLSIIDLSTGHQPIANERETVWVVFNGEIYNYQALRRDLAGRGHRFSTSSDTEVIVHAYEEWGRDAFARLRGMFGLALWDRDRATLWLARDRLGIKPLYYTVHGGRLYYGSELKSLLAAGAVRREVDVSALEHYLALLYTPADRSIFPGVRKLPPGHVLEWRNGAAQVSAFWTPDPREVEPSSEGDAIDVLHERLRDAVRSHLMSDVPLGAFLSGGLDSSLVVALMAEASDRPVKTFSIGFDEPAYDELDSARVVATHFGTEHHEFVVRPDALRIVEQVVEHFDEPFADPSSIPTWYVSQMARRHVTVVLSGDGGDELFGGYDRYLPHARVAQFDRLALPGMRTAAGLTARALPRGATGRRFLRHVALDADDRYIDAVTFYGPRDRASLLSRELEPAEGPTPEEMLAGRLAAVAHLPAQSRQMRLDFSTYLPEDVLVKVDRMSMAHSIESRVPLLDHPLVEFALSLPLSFKIRHDERKYLLRQVARRVLPAAVLAKRKQGFGMPIGPWFRGRLREAFGDVLHSARTAQRGYFDPREVQRVLGEHLSGKRDHEMRLWQLLMFELWSRAYLDAAPSAVARMPLVVATQSAASGSPSPVDRPSLP